jgi:ribosome-associated translation inhibitor RaiA
MKEIHVLSRTSIYILILIVSLLMPENLQADDGEGAAADSAPETVWVAQVRTGDFVLPDGAEEFLKYSLEMVLEAVGGAEILAKADEADTVLSPVVTAYSVREDPGLGFIADIRVDLELNGRQQGRVAIGALGQGNTVYAAVQSAVNEIRRQSAYKLQDTAFWTPAVRIIDTAAGRAILDAGGKKGVRAGQEFFYYPEGRSVGGNTVLLKVSTVFDDFSEAHFFRRPDDIPYGQRLYPAERAGLKTNLSGRFLVIFSDEQENSQARWSVISRTYFDRGLFTLNPLLGLEYVYGRYAAVQLGTGLNWYFGPLICTPALGCQVGVPEGGGESVYWGGFSEIGLQWVLGRRFVLHGEIGVSSLYYAGSDAKDFQFLYSGLGIMLKY